MLVENLLKHLFYEKCMTLINTAVLLCAYKHYKNCSFLLTCHSVVKCYHMLLLMCIHFRELGLIEEAEHLLSDMCSLYSPENWTIFTANAISLLAECQKTLHLDVKYPSLMFTHLCHLIKSVLNFIRYLLSCLSLAVLPQGVGTSHDPCQCLDEIVELSKSISQGENVCVQKSQYCIIVK